MSELPAGWMSLALGGLGDWFGGGTPSKSNAAFWGGDLPWVSPKDMKRARIDDAQDKITRAAVQGSATSLIPAGAVLIVTRSGILRHSLPVAVNTREVAINQDLKALVVAPFAEPDFIAMQLKSCAQSILARCAKSGTTVDSVDFDLLKAFELVLPPLAEQRRIVARLDALTACTARARADLDRIPALAARYKQAVLAKAFSGELTAEWRRENPTENTGEVLQDQLLQQRAKRRQAEGIRSAGANRSVPTDDRTLPALPLGWTWMTFDQCSWDLTVGHVGPMKDRYVPNGIPFLRSLNVKPNAISLKNLVFVSAGFHAELRKSQLSAGTIVVIRTGEPGVAAVVPESLDGANCSDLVICRPVEGLNPHFGARYINSDFAKSFIRDTQVGVAQQHFNVGAMSKLPAPVAPAPEQVEIVRRIDHAFAEIDRLTAEAASARHLLDRLDQAMLAKAFRGQLVPQDPADEPASALLDRIKAEREAEDGKPNSRGGRRPTRSKEQAMNEKPLSPRERVLKDSENWPALGLPFEAIAARNAMPHDQLRDTLFELLAGSSPTLQQRFDTDAELMMIKRIAA